MLNALGKAIGQLADPRLRRPIWLTLATSLAVVVALVAASWLLLARLSLIGIGWVDAAIDFLAGAGVLVVAWLLFPATMASFFATGLRYHRLEWSRPPQLWRSER